MSDRSIEEPADVIAGSVVRELVDRNERDIEALRHELEVALREAEQAEKLIAAHPAADELTPRPAPLGRPRTTVVSRTYAGSAGEPGAAGPP
jgi:hypothetical protein